MKDNFTAQIVELAASEDDVLLIGFSEDDTNVNSLIISYSHILDEQDKKFGWSRYYIEIGTDGIGAYNCVSSVSLMPGVLRMRFNDAAGKKFELKEVQIHFKVTDEKYSALKDRIKDAFFDEPKIELDI